MGKNKPFDHKAVEAKWQELWLKEGIFTPDIHRAKNPYYNLMMYPYPSAEGLHIGNMYAFTGSDVYGRFQRMQGHDVFEPIGLDGFGIHSENYALKIGKNPADLAKETEKRFYGQLHKIGNAFDWTRTLETYDRDYYRWTQWLFVQLFKAGLAYRKAAKVNWCPSCKTVLSDEQVIAGKCERCATVVEKKEVEQWFFRITAYAEKLLNNLAKIDWPEKIKLIQKNWIGRSEGATIYFRLKGSGENIEVFTTRPDTLFGATFLVLSPESPWLNKVTTQDNLAKVSEYVKSVHQLASKSVNQSRNRIKTGVFTGGCVINPATQEEVPIWVADYVLSEYGSGAIMGVPSHDERDEEFALAHKLEVRQIVPDNKLWDMVEKKDWGKRSVSFHLRDWLISRQRYWGPPIPMLFCERCKRARKSWLSENQPQIYRDSDWDHFGWWPEEKLPVELPHIEDYRPTGTGRGPLANHPEFYETICPHCGGKASRETDVSDTFLDSAWYFLRYPSVPEKSASPARVQPHQLPWDPEITKKWLPVDLYFGGAEHAVLHLMYSRFMTMVLMDLGYLDFDEPFPKFFAHGLMIKDGHKMSKSRGNVVNPDEYIEKFGADALRLYLMFIGPMDGSPDFRDTGMEGMKRFVDRLWALFQSRPSSTSREIIIKMHQTMTLSDNDMSVRRKLHTVIKKVTEDIENFRYNTAIAAIMEFVNLLSEKADFASSRSSSTFSGLQVPKKSASAGGSRPSAQIRCAEWEEALKNLCLMLAPFAPHMTEEIWHQMGNKTSVHKAAWPHFEPNLAREEKVTLAVQVNGKLRAELWAAIPESENQVQIEKMAKSEPNVAKWLEGKKIKRVVFVPGRLINFVV